MTQAPSPSPATPAKPTPPPAPSRRNRLRAATMEEITATARRLLVEQGPEAMSLRAIAREMGMTAPGLYRYYSSREELLRHVVASMFGQSKLVSGPGVCWLTKKLGNRVTAPNVVMKSIKY